MNIISYSFDLVNIINKIKSASPTQTNTNEIINTQIEKI